MARSLAPRTTVPTVEHGRAPAVADNPASQAVQLSPRNSVSHRDSPTELFVTSLVLASFNTRKRKATDSTSTPSPPGETIDHGRLTLSQDGHCAVFNGFWWASSGWIARQFWDSEFAPPAGYRVVASDTVMIPRRLLQATREPQRIGRSKAWLNLYSLAGGSIKVPFAHASYIRATSAEMAVRLWRSSPHGIAANYDLTIAMQVPNHWIRGVLASPAISEPLNHDQVARISR